MEEAIQLTKDLDKEGYKGPDKLIFSPEVSFHRLREKMQNRPNLEHISSSDKKKVYRTPSYYIQSLDGHRNKIREWVSLLGMIRKSSCLLTS